MFMKAMKAKAAAPAPAMTAMKKAMKAMNAMKKAMKAKAPTQSEDYLLSILRTLRRWNGCPKI